MRKSFIAVVSAAVVGATPALAQTPGPPASQTLMQRLERFCIATKGDADAAVRLARQDGFVTPPAQFLNSVPPEMRDLNALWLTYDGGVALMMVGQMVDRRSPMRGDVCAVASAPRSASAVGDLERWLGAKFGSQPFVAYVEQDDGSRRIIPNSSDIAVREAMTRGKLRAIGAMERDQMTMLLLIKVRP